MAFTGQKTENLLRQMRTCRMLLANDYCEEIQAVTCLDVIRLELLAEANEMRRRAYLLPREAMVHKLPVARSGEHSFAAYREREEDEVQKVQLFDQEAKKIFQFWAVPSFNEIFAIDA